MSANVITADLLAKMFINGARNLESKKEYINELNVFPVPDGDTGTNMTLTITAAAKEVVKIDSPDMDSICKAISTGSLRGARGNSGVILSQLFRGFTKLAKENQELTIPLIASACNQAVETAYKAVMKPKEGTILTVASGVAVKAKELADAGETDLDRFLKLTIEYADEVLQKTPEMLPVLKQAGVVDSGGQGLVEVLKGAYSAFLGKEIEGGFEDKVAVNEQGTGATQKSVAEAEIKYGYCTEFIILLNRTFNIKQEMDFKEYLEAIGDSIVVVADEEVVKVHVHTNDPGLAIQRALKFGALSNMKIDNMRLEHQEKIIKMEEKQLTAAAEQKVENKKYGFIAVSVGEGINEIFKSLNADYLIEGGQTMNPSTEDMLNAIDQVRAENIFILPNNKNIILAANQARDLTENKNIIVIPTKTVPQGISALINFNPEVEVEENEKNMTEMAGGVSTGQVTYAVRDTMIDDKTIKQGDFMGIGDRGILSVGTDLTKVVVELVAEMMDDDKELISIYYGSDVKEEDAKRILSELEGIYDEVDIEFQYGGQPIYYYIISAE